MSYHDPFLAVSTDLIKPIQSFSISVLLIDDQMIVYEAVKRMLTDQSDIVLHFCSEPSKALAKAAEVKPTVILQDLVMPEFDGLMLVKYFRANPATRDIPIIVLSAKEDPTVKAEAFSLGANDYIVKLPDPIELIARIRYHSDAYIRLLERNEAFKKLEEGQKILQRELAEAAAYVKSLLPPPLTNEIKTDWRFIPSTQLGGDAFGYHWLDERYFAIYLLDVCGHGVGAALHSISVANVLRAQNLPKADFYDPSSVLTALNLAFQMEQHNNMFFTIWYGIYDKESGKILYSSGGHPPAILITGESPQKSRVYELKTPGIVIGVLTKGEFQNAECQVGLYNRLYVFSDGVYEIRRLNGQMLELHEFIDLLMKSPKKEGYELDYIVQFIQNIQGKTLFPDDFSLLQFIFAR
jgi:sigma-B regulation protein RsbU (phosphoserine phosphatase)